MRTLGGFTELIQSPDLGAPPTLYDNGVPIPTANYSIDAVGNVTFVTPPAATHLITADFTYYWLVRFEEDKLDFDRFMARLYTLKQVKLVYVKQ